MAQNKIESQIYKKALNKAYLNLLKDPSMNNVLDVYSICEYLLKAYPRYYKECFIATDLCKKLLAEEPMFKKDKSLQKLWWQIIFLEGTNKNVDSGLVYLERYRPFEKQFYMPRRETFLRHNIIQSLQDLVDDKLDLLTISLPPRVGKAQPLYSKILTPKGWVEMRDIKVGSYVIGADGKKTKVLGVFPQGKMKIYEVVFNDGTKTRCSENHLWKVKTNDDRRYKKDGRIIELKEMLAKGLHQAGKKRYRVDYCKAVEYDKKKLKLHPYLMGALLGDGCFCNNSITFTKPDLEIIDKMKKLLPKNDKMKYTEKYSYRITKADTKLNFHKMSDTRKAISDYGLDKHNSYKKFIPKDYLYSDIKDRWELLKGLLDTDGTVDKRGKTIEYSTVSERLKDDVVELVFSLGGKATWKQKKTLCNGKEGKAYKINIFFGHKENPFYLKRKRERVEQNGHWFYKYISEINYVGEEKCQCIYVDNKDHLYLTDNFIPTHNTTLSQFFQVLLGGWYPEKQVFSVSYSQSIVNMFYNGYLSIITDKHTYAWQEMFGAKTKLQGNNAKDTWVNLGDPKNFKTYTARSIDGTITGSIQAGILLSCDDLVKNIEEAMNKNALAKIYTKYSTDLIQRKIQGAKELHIATRWSVWDVIGRIEAQKQNDDRARFIRVPALNSKGESNFNYPMIEASFDTKFYLDIQEVMDPVSFNCLYQQEPVEREGLLFENEKMRRYFERPSTEPDKIWATCDTKDKGSDFLCMPIAYQYGEDFYIEDVVFTDSTDYDYTDNELANKLIEHKVNVCRFESNNSGGRVASDVQKILDERKARISLQTKFTRTNKETKILTNSDWIMKHCLFKDESKMTKQYKEFFTQIITYTAKGKNPHDDSVDGLAQLSEFVADGSSTIAEIIKSPI